MGLIEGLLAFIGFLTVIAACGLVLAYWFERELRPRVEAIDDPYRDGLDAAARISAMAFGAEQAMRHTAEEAKREEE
jgi:hypothetical protein